MSSKKTPLDRSVLIESAKHLIDYIGDDSTREGLLDTPERWVKALEFWFSGYDKNPEDVMKTFEDGAGGYDGIVIVKDISFHTHCEHHMAPFFGKVHIGYIPDKRILGLSKFARLTEIYGRRLQVQERLTTQIADAIDEYLKPKAVGVIIEAKHTCMCSRGVRETESSTTTSAMRGFFADEIAARAEFLQLLRK